MDQEIETVSVYKPIIKGTMEKAYGCKNKIYFVACAQEICHVVLYRCKIDIPQIRLKCLCYVRVLFSFVVYRQLSSQAALTFV